MEEEVKMIVTAVNELTRKMSKEIEIIGHSPWVSYYDYYYRQFGHC